MKIINIFVLLSACFVFSTKFVNATGFEDLLPLRSKSATLNEGGIFFNTMKNRGKSVCNINEKDICKICRKEYIRKNYNQKYCTKNCKDISIKEYFNKKYIKTRFRIFERDKFKCVYCGKSSIEDGIKLVIEHIYPLSKDGENDLDNIVTACETCNKSKSIRVLDNDITLRLWNRNHQLNMNFKKQEYKNLKDLFDKMFKSRVNQIHTNRLVNNKALFSALH